MSGVIIVSLVLLFAVYGRCTVYGFTWTVVYEGRYNESLTDLSTHYGVVRDDVVTNSDSRIDCPPNLISHGPSTGGLSINVTLQCTTTINIFAIDRANNRLHKAVNAGSLGVQAAGISLTSSLPLYYNDLIFDPDSLTGEEIIIIAITVSVSAIFFIIAMLIILKIQQKTQSGSVTPSNEDSDTESEIATVDKTVESQQRGTITQNKRRQTLAEITPKYGTNTKEITEWQPTDFYPVEQKSNDLLEFRMRRRVYQLLSDKSFSKLLVFQVDINGSLQKLRCELQLKLKKKTGSIMFLFLTEDLEPISPQSECSYVIFTIYKSHTVLIRLLQAKELEENGWMLCPCGNIGKHHCNCQKQLYCSRFCQQQHSHKEMCDVVRPPALEE